MSTMNNDLNDGDDTEDAFEVVVSLLAQFLGELRPKRGDFACRLRQGVSADT